MPFEKYANTDHSQMSSKVENMQPSSQLSDQQFNKDYQKATEKGDSSSHNVLAPGFPAGAIGNEIISFSPLITPDSTGATSTDIAKASVSSDIATTSASAYFAARMSALRDMLPSSAVLRDGQVQPDHAHEVHRPVEERHVPGQPPPVRDVHRPAEATDAPPPPPLPERDQRLVERMRARGATAEELRTFTDDLRRLRARGLSDREITRTLDQVERLMESRGDRPVTQDERRRIGMQVIHHAARPTDIDQGSHSTCQVTALEERMFTRCPSKAAEMIVSCSINGYWDAPDGKRITVASGPLGSVTMSPGREERATYPADGERSHASQIFNLVAVNEATQRRVPPQFYRQDTVNNATDSGERVYDRNGQPVYETVNGRRQRVQAPSLSDAEIAAIGFRTTGENNYYLCHSRFGDIANVGSIHSTQELIDTIQRMKRDGKLPATIGLDMNHPGLGGTGLARDKDRWHCLSVTDYDPATGRFFISNQWGAAGDRWVSANDMFQSMGGWPR